MRMPTPTDSEPTNNGVVKIKTMSRERMEEAIEKVASESNSDYYICPFCYTRRPKEHVVVHKKACTGLR
jgi:hypothetical protein